MDIDVAANLNPAHGQDKATSSTKQEEIESAIASLSNSAKVSKKFETSIAIAMVPEKIETNVYPVRTLSTCSSTVVACRLQTLKGFEFCHKHILEDKTSPYQYCSYVFREDSKRCVNPAPKLGDQKSFCLYHEKQKTKLKKRREKRAEQQQENKLKKNKQNNAGLKVERRQSSSEEEYSFFTDSFRVDKTACTWLGNQASDAESTDSEDENPLNHAGTWTLEECVRICKEKMERLRFLYMQQYKRLSYSLREDRRKMLNEFDMDPYTISKVGVPEKSDDPYRDFVEDAHLTNYQKMSGVELLAEKQMKEKKTHGNYGKRSELPRCHNNIESVRCISRALPFSKYCHQHICQDQEQFLFEQCTNKDQNNQAKCVHPADMFHEHCRLHTILEPSKSKRLLIGIDVAKKAKESKKRKVEQTKCERKDVEKKPEVVYHNTRRASKNREDTLKSPTGDRSPRVQLSSGERSPKVQLFEEMKPSPTTSEGSCSTSKPNLSIIEEKQRDVDGKQSRIPNLTDLASNSAKVENNVVKEENSSIETCIKIKIEEDCDESMSVDVVSKTTDETAEVSVV